MTDKNLPYNPLDAKTALQLAAPHTWAASVLPALFGVLLCGPLGCPLPWYKAPALLAACVLMQSAVNTLNDYFDFVKGADTAADAVEQSDAALVYAGIAPQSAKRLGLGFLAAAAVLGLGSCIGSGPAPLLVGLVGGAMILAYSGGPLPVSYLPVGEAVSGITMGGLIPLGVTACAAGKLLPQVLLYSLPFILGIALIMMSNNGCDIEKDLRAGRRTLPALLGRPGALRLYRALLGVWLLTAVLWPWFYLPGAAALANSVCVLALAGPRFAKVARLGLAPAGRVAQMKGILAANWLAGASCLGLLAGVQLLQNLGVAYV